MVYNSAQLFNLHRVNERYKEIMISESLLASAVVLQCPHETIGPERLHVRWYKLTSTGQAPLLYQYDGATGVGTAVSKKSNSHHSN